MHFNFMLFLFTYHMYTLCIYTNDYIHIKKKKNIYIYIYYINYSLLTVKKHPNHMHISFHVHLRMSTCMYNIDSVVKGTMHPL